MEAARPAVREDAEACAGLCRRATEELRQMRGGDLYLQREVRLGVETLLRPGGLDDLRATWRRHVVVGTIDEAVVGLAVAHVDRVGEAALGVVDGCYVEPEARGVGVGRALLDALMAWFATHCCEGVDAGALPGDRRTKNFYEAAGFKARLLTLHHRPR